MFRSLAIASLLLAATAVPASAANLIVNGGFEADDVLSPSQGGIGYQTFGSSFTGWTVNGPGNIDIVDHYAGGNAGEGDQWLDLVGDTARGGISQSFTTTAGKAYKLSFLVGNNPFSTNFASFSYSVAGLNGVLGSASGLNFGSFFAYFTGTGNDTLTFTDLDGANSGGIALDAVSVTAVPEPASWALMIAGFGLVGGAMRRRGSTRPALA